MDFYSSQKKRWQHEPRYPSLPLAPRRPWLGKLHRCGVRPMNTATLMDAARLYLADLVAEAPDEYDPTDLSVGRADEALSEYLADAFDLTPERADYIVDLLA